MLPKELRLLSHEISSVRNQGNVLSKDGIFFFYILSTHPLSRFSVIVTKKAAKKAVQRNYIKRITRHILTPYASQMKQPLSVVIVIRSFHSYQTHVTTLEWIFNNVKNI
jgi:ribonuclease P protein component